MPQTGQSHGWPDGWTDEGAGEIWTLQYDLSRWSFVSQRKDCTVTIKLTQHNKCSHNTTFNAANRIITWMAGRMDRRGCGGNMDLRCLLVSQTKDCTVTMKLTQHHTHNAENRKITRMDGRMDGRTEQIRVNLSSACLVMPPTVRTCQ